jgi:hypothetical protein
MMKLHNIYASISLIIVFISSVTWAGDLENVAIYVAKNTKALELEDGMPSIRLESWLKQISPPGSDFEWTIKCTPLSGYSNRSVENAFACVDAIIYPPDYPNSDFKRYYVRILFGTKEKRGLEDPVLEGTYKHLMKRVAILKTLKTLENILKKEYK